MRLIDGSHPFFRPIWRRVAVTAFCFAWAGFEIYTGAFGWAAVVGLLGLLCVYELFVAYDKDAGDGDG